MTRLTLKAPFFSYPYIAKCKYDNKINMCLSLPLARLKIIDVKIDTHNNRNFCKNRKKRENTRMHVYMNQNNIKIAQSLFLNSFQVISVIVV